MHYLFFIVVLEDYNDEEVDKINDEIIVPTENDNKLLNWNDDQFDNLDDARSRDVARAKLLCSFVVVGYRPSGSVACKPRARP